MVTERVITLPTEPIEGEIVKSHPLFSFINIGQRGRIYCLFMCTITHIYIYIKTIRIHVKNMLHIYETNYDTKNVIHTLYMLLTS